MCDSFPKVKSSIFGSHSVYQFVLINYIRATKINTWKDAILVMEEKARSFALLYDNESFSN